MNGHTCTNDILGNRLTKGSDTYGWDALNRMTSYNATAYQYRADGMRTKKVVGSATTTYRYDGQMGIQDVEVAGSTTTVTDYALGARGVDAISTKVGANPATVSYPLYDAHGNMISTLSKNGSGYTYSALRSFDAWGGIRTGATTGDPKGRYCASIGHKQDDESGLVYMRARYYEPGSGRFISEDRAKHSSNWFAYCGNSPTNAIDDSGNESSPLFRQFVRIAALCIGGAMIANAYFAAFAATETVTPPQLVLAYNECIQAITVIGLALVYTSGTLSQNQDIAFVLALAAATFGWLQGSVAAAALGGKTYAKNAVAACFGYTLIIAGFLLADLVENY